MAKKKTFEEFSLDDEDVEYVEFGRKVSREDRLKIFELLKGMKDRTISEAQMLDLFKLLGDNYFDGDDVRYTISNLKDGATEAGYSPLLNACIFSKSFINDFYEGKCDFIDILNDFGHEMTHYSQYKIKNEVDGFTTKQKSKIKKATKFMLKSLDESYIKEDEASIIYDLIGVDFESEKEKNSYINALNYSHYLQLKYEEDARVGGYEFARDILERWSKDKLCDKELKDWFKDISSGLDKIKKTENRNRNRYKFYDKIKEEIDNLNHIAFGNIELRIRDRYKKGGSELMLQQAFVRMLNIRLANKNPKELENFIVFSISNGLNMTADILFGEGYYKEKTYSRTNILKELQISDKEKEEIGQKVTEKLLSREINKSSLDIDYSKLLNTEQMKEVSKSFIKEDESTLGNFFSFFVFSLSHNMNGFRTSNLDLKDIASCITHELIARADRVMGNKELSNNQTSERIYDIKSTLKYVSDDMSKYMSEEDKKLVEEKTKDYETLIDIFDQEAKAEKINKTDKQETNNKEEKTESKSTKPDERVVD